MQVTTYYTIKNFHRMITSYIFEIKQDMHAKKNHAMENHVRRGIAVHTT